MKLTRFYDIHTSLNAKIVEFAGYKMPIQYPAGILAEHKTIRENVGVFDVSHMGEFAVKGKDALAFIQKITVNDASKLTDGKVQYSAMCYEDGGIVDDLLVYKFADNSYMLVVNGANIDKDWDWCQKNIEGFDLELINETDDISLLAVQGPKSRETLQKLTEVNISEEEVAFYTFKVGKLAGHDMIISRTGYTGELGFELYFYGDEKVAKEVWDAIFEAGKEFGIEPTGLGCRDTLRLEKGYCLYGNDIDQTTNPIEAGLGWITKVDKGEFNGKAPILETKANPKRRLIAFVVEADRFIARHGYKVFSGDTEIGHVTSGNLSPTLNVPIGMAYIAWDYKAPDTKIEIEARGKKFPAKVVKLPFVA